MIMMQKETNLGANVGAEPNQLAQEANSLSVSAPTLESISKSLTTVPTLAPHTRALMETLLSSAQMQAERGKLSALNTETSGIQAVNDLDSSQEAALNNLRHGGNLVITAPAGVGQSNAIANILADSVAQGKRVLFVCDTAETTDGVKRALKNAGLSELALSLSAGQNGSQLASEISATLKLGRPVTAGETAQVVDRHEQCARRLEQHVGLLTEEIGESGFSSYQAISNLIALSEKGSIHAAFDPAKMRGWNKEQHDSALALCQSLERFVEEHGLPVLNPFFGAKICSEDITSIEDVRGKLEIVNRTGRKLDKELSSLFQSLRLTTDLPETELLRTLEAVIRIDDFYSDNGKLLKAVNFKHEKWAVVSPDIDRVFAAAKRCLELRAEYKEILTTDAWNTKGIKLEQAKAVLLAKGQAGWLTQAFSGDLSEAEKLIRKCFRNQDQVPQDVAGKVKIIDLLLEAQAHRLLQKEFSPFWNELIGAELNPTESEQLSDWAKARSVAKFVVSMISDLGRSTQFSWLCDLMKNPQVVYQYSTQIRELENKLTDFLSARESLGEMLKFDQAELKKKLSAKSFEDECNLYEGWFHNLDQLERIIEFNDMRSAAKKRNQDFIVETVERAEKVQSSLSNMFELAWFSGLVTDFMTYRPRAAGFSREATEEAISGFQAADRALLVENSVNIAAQHWNKMTELSNTGRVAELRRELGSKAPVTASSEVFKKYGAEIQGVKPIFISGSSEWNDTLRSAGLNFDLVLIDQSCPIERLPTETDWLGNTQLAFIGDAYNQNAEDQGTQVSNVVDLAKVTGTPVYKVRSYKSGEYGSASATAGVDGLSPTRESSATTQTLKSSREVLEPFINSVKRELEKRGYKVEQPVGAKGSILDLAVVNPLDPKRYILGLVSDGPNYQAVSSTSERERIQPEALAQRGWNIHRLWVLGWLKDPKLEVELVEHAIKKAIIKDNTTFRKKKVSTTVDEMLVIEREQGGAANVKTKSTGAAPSKLSLEPDAMMLSQYFTDPRAQDRWREGVALIINSEAPIKADALAKRVLELSGMRTLTPETITMLRAVIQNLAQHGRIELKDGTFYRPRLH